MYKTIICSIITTIITVKFNYHGETLKALRDSREKLYTEIFENIEKLINNGELVFEKEFMNSLVKTKHKVKLIASDHVIKAYKELYELCKKCRMAYEAFLQENDPEEALQNRDDELYATNTDMEELDKKVANFRKENVPSPESLSMIVRKILIETRYDIGNSCMYEIRYRISRGCNVILCKICSAISKLGVKMKAWRKMLIG